VLPRFEPGQRSILEKVAAHDGQWYWYQLDRAIVSSFPQLAQELMPAIRELETGGLFRITPNPKQPDLQVYWITEQSRTLLNVTELIDAPFAQDMR
jgi:DNA-binding HxlR family transcriptional regulator